SRTAAYGGPGRAGAAMSPTPLDSSTCPTRTAPPADGGAGGGPGAGASEGGEEASLAPPALDSPTCPTGTAPPADAGADAGPGPRASRRVILDHCAGTRPDGRRGRGAGRRRTRQRARP